MARQLYEAGVDVPFLSVLTPFPGTPVYLKYQAAGRILPGRGWEFYNGYNVAFQPKEMTPEELQKIADENDTTPEKYLKDIHLLETLRKMAAEPNNDPKPE